MVATDPGSGFLTGDSGEETLPRLVFGVAGGCGVGGQVSPAKLALADALDGVDDRFELRIHGVGGSSAEQMLGRVETVQAGGDDTAQFLRRVAVARQPAVRWPLEGYRWGRADLARPGQGVLSVLDPVDVVRPGQLDAPCARWPASAARLWARKRLPPAMRLGGMHMSTSKDTSTDSPQSNTPGPARGKVMDYQTLRSVIGGTVILLVPVVYIGNWLIFMGHRWGCFYSPQWIPGSLSGFYYTHMRNLFVGAMCAVGVFFVAYRGHDRWDDRLTNVAGFAAICIALFPTMPPPKQFFTRANQCGPSTQITYHLSSYQSSIRYVHVVSLFVLFLMVFLIVLVQFTRTKPSKAELQPPVRGSLRAWWKALFPVKQLAHRIRAWWKELFTDPRRRVQNRVFVACADGIALSALLALFTAIWSSAGNTVPLLLFAECLAFLCFGFAWFVKGRGAKARTRLQLAR